MGKAIFLIWKYRHVLWTTTKNDVKSRYAGSTLGILWALVYPILLLGVYTLLYVGILKVRTVSMTTPEYTSLIFCGLVPFLGFSEALGSGVGSVTSNPNLIKNTMFPIELVPLRTVLSSTITQIVGTVLLLIALSVMGKASIFFFLVPLIFVMQLLFTTGFIWFVSSVNVLARDMSQITSVLMIFFIMISPIGYTPDMIPEGFRTLAYVNPLYSIITVYREVIFYGRLPSALDITFFVMMSLASFSAGFFIFMKLKQVFADYV